jgi:hypothetical protein
MKMDLKRGPENAVRRLAAAAVILFTFSFLAGLLAGQVFYGALFGIVLVIIFSRPVSKRLYTMEFANGAMIPVAVSLVLFFALTLVSILLRNQTEDPAVRIAIGLLPALPVAAAALFIGRALGQLDDLQRRIQSEGLAVGFGISIVLAAVYGWLTLFGVPSIGWIYAAPVMALCWVAGKLFSVWRFR